ncbi:MAG: hypothetical protein R3B09_06705 [Nannocystaceae bacterium]
MLQPGENRQAGADLASLAHRVEIEQDRNVNEVTQPGEIARLRTIGLGELFRRLDAW